MKFFRDHPSKMTETNEVKMIEDFEYTVRPTSEDEYRNNMPYVTSSMVEAVNTCPRWGIIHNIHNKRFVTGYRQMALEAGSLMHEVLSILNLAQVGIIQNLPEHACYHGQTLFPEGRYEIITKDNELMKSDPDNVLQTLERLAFNVIETSDYYDDPSDRNRTLSNLETCALVLIPYWYSNLASFNIYVEDKSDPTKPIGVEFSLDTVFELIDSDGIVDSIRFIGLIDTLYINEETGLVKIGEYKTASSMNDAWKDAFQTRHQITAYNAALRAYFDNVSYDTILLGSAVPVTKTKVNVQHFDIFRDEGHIKNFLRTVLFTQSMIDQFYNTPTLAPMFTHSCNRYFRTCSLMDLCASEHEDQLAMFEQMETAPSLSPSEQKALLRSS